MSQPNINVEKLKELLIFIIDEVSDREGDWDEAKTLLRAAFPPQPKEEWRPKEDELYYYISNTGKINAYRWEDSENDRARLEFGNCFENLEAAEAFKAKYLEWRRGV